MQVDYAALKQQMRDASIEVSEGDHFGVEEATQYQRFVAGVAYASGVPYNPISAAVGLAFPQELPPALGSQIGTGVFVNGKPWAAGINNGYLIVGTGNPAVNFQIANGVGVQVGLSVRYRQDMAIPPGSADGYKLPATRNGEDWTFAFSIATQGEAVLADYDVHLILSLDSTGAPTPVLDFVYDADANTFTAEGVDPIIDNAVNDEGTAVQNIQSYGFTFIKEKLLPESMREAATPYGLYVLTLTATHKETDAVTTLAIPVNITN